MIKEGVKSVNMHELGTIFVERVLDVRKRHSEGSETVAPGELLEFLAQTGVAIGGQDEEKSTLTAIKLHWSARCAGGRSRH